MSNKFQCYEIWRPNIPNNGCSKQCQECKAKQEYNNEIEITKTAESQLRKNFYCGDEVDYGEQCSSQCDGCVDATGVDYGFLPPEEQCTCKTGEPYNNTCCKVHGSIPKEDLGYTTKSGINVSDEFVRALMIPKERFDHFTSEASCQECEKSLENCKCTEETLFSDNWESNRATPKEKLEVLVHTWQQQQIQYEALAEKYKENEHNFKKYKYKAMATRDCWKELLKTINEMKW